MSKPAEKCENNEAIFKQNYTFRTVYCPWNGLLL